MHVGRAARIPRCGSENKMTIVVIKEISTLVRHTHLIGLLKILPSHVVVRALGRQDVIGYLFELICIKNIAGNRQHTFKRKHELHGRAELRSLCRVIAV